MAKISVIMATFNVEDVLPGAISAFAAQTHPDKELLIADGGSHDGTAAIIATNHTSVAWSASEPDHGIFDAWNKGILRADGEWLYFMGADDRFASDDALVRVAKALSGLSAEVLVAYGQVALIATSGEIAETLGGPWNAGRFRTQGMTIPHQGCFTRRAYFERYGLFTVDGSGTATYEFYLRHLARHDAVFLPGLVVGNMGVGGISTRPENQLRFLNAYVVAQRRQGVFRITPRLVFDYGQALIKVILFRLLPEPVALDLVERLRSLAGKKRHYAQR